MFEGQQEMVLTLLHKFTDDPDSDVKRFAGMIRAEDRNMVMENGFNEESMNVDQERSRETHQNNTTTGKDKDTGV